MSNINQTRIITKVVKGKTIPVCIKFLCFKCEEVIENEFKTYKNEKNNYYYVCEDCVPVLELLKKKKAEDKWANLAKKLLEPKKEEKKKELPSKETSQKILFEIFLKETFSKYPNWEIFKDLLLTIEDMISGKLPTDPSLISSRRFYTLGKDKIDMDRFLYNFHLEKKNDFGRKLFDWGIKKLKIIGKDMGLPSLTFISSLEATIVGRRLLQEWWERFETLQEMFNWIDGVEEIMLK